jgi:transposase
MYLKNTIFMQYLQTIGIDVSKNHLDFALYQNHQVTYLGRVNNQIKDLEAYLNQLGRKYELATTLFCLETTGVYTQPFLVVAMQAPASVWLQSALEISQSLGLKRAKNDVLDAQAIAEYAFRQQDKARLYVAPNELLSQIQCLLKIRSNLLATAKRLEVPIHEAELFNSAKIAEKMANSVQNTLAGISEDLQTIEQDLMDLLAEDEQLQKNFELTQSVVGVGKITALEILVTTRNFTKFETPEQYACYCGVVPFGKSSGKIKGKNKISFLAHQRMKMLLHMCALSAVRHDPELKAYYERKVKAGKSKMSVLNAVRNKIILRIFAIIKKQQKYEKKDLKNLECS